MILDITKLKKEQVGTVLFFKYPLTFDNEEQFANIVVEGEGDNRQISVYLSKLSEISTNLAQREIIGEVLSSNDIKIAWEQFENLFNQSDEGKAQQPEQPEPKNLFCTFDATGKAILFLQNLNNEQEVIFEFTIDDLELKSKRPKDYVLDFTDDTNMPEQLRAKWFMANTNGEVILEGTNNNNSYSTYQVAVVSVAPPSGENPQPPQDGDNPQPPQDGDNPQPPQDGGDPPPPNGGTPQPPQDGDNPQPPQDGGDPPPPNGGTPQPPQDGGDIPPPNGGNPPPPNGGTPQPPQDDDNTQPIQDDSDPNSEDQVGEKTSLATYDNIIQTISDVSGYSNSEVNASLRDEENFIYFIEINNVNWREIAKQTGLSNNLYKFATEVFNIVENN